MARTRRPSFFPAGIFALAGLFAVSGIAQAQSYGPGDQVTTVPAGAFRPAFGGNTTYSMAGGYLFGVGGYTAGISIPDGAVVTQVCAYIYDPDGPSQVSASIHEVGLAAGGQSSFDSDVLGLFANFDIGYGVACQDSPGILWRDLDTVAGINLTHYLSVGIYANAGLGGIRVTWHRTVSSPPATPTFNDVPPNDAFFPFVEALVSSGITAGCGSGNFCPDAPLTRRQMAVFLSKALGLHWPY